MSWKDQVQNSCHTSVPRIYPDSRLSHTGYPWSHLLLVLVVPFWVRAMCPVFLPLLELAFWNYIKDGLWLLPNFKDILKTTPHSCTFILGNKKKSQGTMVIFLVTKKCFYLSMSNHSTNSVEVSHMFSPPLYCTGIFHMRGLIWQLSSKWYYTETLSVFTHTTSGVITQIFTIFNKNFPTFEPRKSLKSLLSPWHCHQNMFWAFQAFLLLCSWVWRKTQWKCIVCHYKITDGT